MGELDKARLDERIEGHMQLFLKKIKETDCSFKVIQTQIRKPIEESRDMSQQEHLFKISKSLLKPVDASKLKERRPLATLYAKTEPKSGEGAALEIIRKMKKEKAMKIARAYSSYRFRRHLNRRIAARKVITHGFISLDCEMVVASSQVEESDSDIDSPETASGIEACGKHARRLRE